MIFRCLRLTKSFVYHRESEVRRMSAGISSVDKLCRENVSILRTFPPAVGAAISRQEIVAKFEPREFSRKSDPCLEEDIENTWKTKVAENPRLFDGSKFRLAGSVINKGRLEIHVGLTSYKDLCGTNFADNCESLMEKGVIDHGNSQAYLSDALGVGILLLTKDNYLVVARRAAWMVEYPNFLDRVGGHPEPAHVFEENGLLKPELGSTDVHTAVMNEIWDSAIQEAKDEVGLERENIEHFSFIGFTVNTEKGRRPSMEFLAKLNLTAAELKALHARGNQIEADELTSLCVLPLPQVNTLANALLAREPRNAEARSDETIEMLREMTSALKGAILLAHHHQMLPKINK